MAFEGVAVRPGQVGVGHGQGEQPDHGIGQAPRGFGRVVVEPAQLCFTACHALQEQCVGTGDHAGQHEDEHRHHQARNGPGDAADEAACHVKQPSGGALTPGPGVSELPQHEGQPQLGHEQAQGPDQHGDDPAQARTRVLQVGRQRTLVFAHRAQQLRMGPAPAAKQQPQQHPGHARGGQRVSHADAHLAQVAHFAVLGHRQLELSLHLVGGGGQRVRLAGSDEVAGGDEKHRLTVDVKAHRVGSIAACDQARSVRCQRLLHGLLRQCGALGG